jgi:pyruvate kinase
MDVARLHFSYAGQMQHAENILRIRRVARRLHRDIIILQDLSGSKMRMNDFSQAWVTLRKGARFTLTSRPVKGNASIASINIPELIAVVKRGDTVLLADGALTLKALSVNKTDIKCMVVVGGKLKSGQAVHIPGKAAPIKVPTAKDRDDVRFGLRHEVDWIAQSYAVSAAEIEALRELIREEGGCAKIITKIERRAALENLGEMIHAADMVMVARGDLGLEIPLEQIALAQKKIIHAAKAASKPVITATEMLLSMMEQPRPTRAEVSDVTNAILEGSNAVMLSGETGMGKFPIETTQMMNRIVRETEKYLAGSAPKILKRS